MRNFIKSLQNRLVNVNRNNKSILHSRLQKNTEIDLVDFLFSGFVQNPHDLLTDLFDGRKSVFLAQDIDARDESSNLLSYRLKKIEHTSKIVFEEKGCLDLYVGWPYIHGVLQNEVVIKCPLLFIPVKLIKESGIWKLSQNTELQISFNRSFLIAYAHYNSISLSKEFIETDFSGFSADFSLFKNQFYDFLKNSPLDIHFNSELFSETLYEFSIKTKEQISQEFRVGQLKLAHTAVLGVFPQYSSYLFPDYDQFLKEYQYKSTEDFLQTKLLTDTLNSNHQENKQYLPFSIDGSQEIALDKVKKGSSLVVQGPPGSGKSQLICNLISDFIARGKKVLVISQKKVALEVVRDRISEVGLSNFCSLVHDVKADRVAVYNLLSSQISHLTDFETSNTQLDSVFLEREFLQVSKQLEMNKAILEEYKISLFDSSRFGISAKELYLNANSELKVLDSPSAEQFTVDGAHFFLAEFSSRFTWYNKFLTDKEFPLKNRLSFELFKTQDRHIYTSTLADLFLEKSNLVELLAQVGITKLDVSQIDKIVEQEIIYKEYFDKLGVNLSLVVLRFFLTASTKEKQSLTQVHKKLETIFKNKKIGFEDIIDVKERVELWQDLQVWESTKGSFFKRSFWRFTKEHTILKNVLSEYGLKWSDSNIQLVYKKVENRRKIDDLIMQLKRLGFVISSKSGHDFLESWLRNWTECQEILSFIKSDKLFFEFIKANVTDFKLVVGKIQYVQKQTREFKAKCSYAHQYLAKEQIISLINDWNESDLNLLIRSVEENFEDLISWDSYWNNVPLFKKTFVQELCTGKNFKTFEDFKATFLQTLYGNWLAVLEKDSPILSLVSSERLCVVESDFQFSVERKKELSKDISLLRVKEKTYTNVVFNRLNNRITYRELEHQVTKKKRLWPMNKLVEQFSTEIFDLVPCWLCSPESASAIFPVQDLFDLVIFDEASQCYLERGFPGLLRGKQVVICGDSKQLQPTDLYSIRWEEEEEYENTDLELESLLAFGERYLESVMLQGHYRSKSTDLIAFSNQFFYDSKLLCIPDKAFLQQKSSVLVYKKVPGYWDKNVNTVEAREIVYLVSNLDYTAKKIGIITFNYKQQELIYDLLEEFFNAREMMFPKSIFVKNIENVQGDEADIVIFSIGYAPTLSAKFVMNFGLLNQEGGENRLNVAVSRAREQIIVVTSIYPNQLEVDSSLHEGPKYLKKYLEFVYHFAQQHFASDQIQTTKQVLRTRYLKSEVSGCLSDEKIASEQQVHFCDVATLDATKVLDKIILTDDQLFFEDKSIKSVYAYLPAQLKQKGWDFKRFYSRNFWKDKNAFHKALMDFVKS